MKPPSSPPLNVLDYAHLVSALLCLVLTGGIILLVLGGDWLCRGAASIATQLNIPPVVIGLTVVSLATSMPELFTGLLAVYTDNHDIAVSNIVGSNIGNIGLILGTAALIYPVAIQRRLINKEMPILLAATLCTTAFLLTDYKLSRIEGLLLLGMTVAYIFFLSREARNKDGFEDLAEDIPEPLGSITTSITFLLMGTLMLAMGADFLVGSSVEIAQRLGISQVVIGMTVVAIGTSLPELAASVAAACRRQSDICAGNIVGSNLFNLILICGGVSTLLPIRVEPLLFQIEIPAMLLLTAFMWLMFISDRKVTRLEGGLLLFIYILVLSLSAIMRA